MVHTGMVPKTHLESWDSLLGRSRAACCLWWSLRTCRRTCGSAAKQVQRLAFWRQKNAEFMWNSMTFQIYYNDKLQTYGYGSIPINTIFSGMNIHLPAILMFTRGTRFWDTAIFIYRRIWQQQPWDGSNETQGLKAIMGTQNYGQFLVFCCRIDHYLGSSWVTFFQAECKAENTMLNPEPVKLDTYVHYFTDFQIIKHPSSSS